MRLPGHLTGRLLAVAALVAGLLVGSPSTALARTLGSFQPYYYSNFNSPLSSSWWTVYSGRPRCCSSTIWSPTHVHVANGVLTLDTSRDPNFGDHWVSAGVSMGRSLNMTYGQWLVRFRMTRGAGVGECMALWPHVGWPPEIDFAEESSRYGATRSAMTATLHYSSHNDEIHNHVSGDFSQWHTLGVDWLPGRIVYLLDGRTWATVTQHVPSQLMHLIIQTGVGSNGSTGVMPNSTTPAHVDLQIDWVVVERYL